MPVELRNAQRRIRLNTRRLKRIGEQLLSAVERREAVLSLLLTDDKWIAELHERWMGDSSSTDVLSFPQRRQGERLVIKGDVPELLGDVVISVETAARRSPRDPMKEIVRYLIHGLLHLMGHDHLRVSDRREMTRETQRLRRAVAGI